MNAPRGDSMSMFQPVSNDRLSDRVVRRLMQMIHAGELPVGARLPNEGQLAEQLGVSRGILREALNLLQARGYITRAPKGGTLISQSSDSDIGSSITVQVRSAAYGDLLDLREALECKVVHKAVELATDEEITALIAFLTQNDASELPRSIDYYFHYRLAQMSRNGLFVVFLDMYFDTIHEIALRNYQDKTRSAQTQREHLRIARALQARNARAAVAAVKAHLTAVRSHIDRNAVDP